ncbi:MAG: hypothetical protein M2R45_04187 [Verrucomicrobia subdivision 3 bacterium]|nr:hypothetical protein [Limisphaerales bacterium]MCS1413008.1 hypothetical protein [Limisphaerales bacterium]
MGCNTAGKEWCDAFGIPQVTSTGAEYQRAGRQPRAIVLWSETISVPRGSEGPWYLHPLITINNLTYGGTKHNEMAEALGVFFNNWMANQPLYECMRLFTDKALEHGFEGIESWQIYGCADLQRNGP